MKMTKEEQELIAEIKNTPPGEQVELKLTGWVPPWGSGRPSIVGHWERGFVVFADNREGKWVVCIAGECSDGFLQSIVMCPSPRRLIWAMRAGHRRHQRNIDHALRHMNAEIKIRKRATKRWWNQSG